MFLMGFHCCGRMDAFESEVVRGDFLMVVDLEPWILFWVMMISFHNRDGGVIARRLDSEGEEGPERLKGGSYYETSYEWSNNGAASQHKLPVNAYNIDSPSSREAR